MKKTYIILFAICSLCISGCGTIKNANLESTNDPNHITTIYAIGDSITAGYQLPIEQSWPSQLFTMLQNAGYKNYKVVNAGVSGETSKQVKDRIGEVISGANSGDIAILVVGGNDGLQGLPIEDMKTNITDSINILQQKGMIVVLGGMRILSRNGIDYINNFKKAYPIIASNTKSALIPFILEGVALKGELNLPDMIHPNEQGYKIVAETVLKTLSKKKLLKK